MLKPYFEDEWILAVGKEPGAHTAPLGPRSEGPEGGASLLEEVLDAYPGIASLPGRKACEPGLLHRLDRDTSGLVLIAKTKEAFGALMVSQAAGLFEKRYIALCSPSGRVLPGARPGRGQAIDGRILSRFRPYGPKGARVAPIDPGIPAAGPVYETEIRGFRESGGVVECRLRLFRGFRHQLRAHLAWIGYPILGDVLYGDGAGADRGRLMLHASALRFPHPSGGLEVLVECPPPEDFAV